MIRAVLLSAALAVAGTFAEAESVRVLSGEHEDFSRIVLLFDERTGWKQTETLGGFEVEFDRKGISLDLSRVFEKIPRDRIDNVEFRANDGILRLDVTCDCVLEIFDEQLVNGKEITEDPERRSVTRSDDGDPGRGADLPVRGANKVGNTFAAALLHRI